MNSLKRNAHGLLIRSNSYGRTSYDALAQELGMKNGETLYAVNVENGARVSRPIKNGQTDVQHKPGSTFVAGPTITKAAALIGVSRGSSTSIAKSAGGEGLPSALKKEVEELRVAGFGAVPAPEMTAWGWAIRLKGLVLAGGTRTDAMILLPKAYPAASPIGFYLRNGARTGALDASHLFNGAHHGAPDLTREGWQWFCGILDAWAPGRHSLVTYITCVFAMFTNEGLKG